MANFGIMQRSCQDAQKWRSYGIMMKSIILWLCTCLPNAIIFWYQNITTLYWLSHILVSYVYTGNFSCYHAPCYGCDGFIGHVSCVIAVILWSVPCTIPEHPIIKTFTNHHILVIPHRSYKMTMQQCCNAMTCCIEYSLNQEIKCGSCEHGLFAVTY